MRQHLVRLVPSSLAGRLVATLVALVLLSTVVVASLTTVLMRSYLLGQDRESVQGRLNAVAGVGDPSFRGPDDSDDDQGRGRVGRPPVPGNGLILDTRTGHLTNILVLDDGTYSEVDAAQRTLLEQVPADRKLREIDLPGAGPFLVAADRSQGLVVVGQSTGRADDIIGNLVLVELLLGAGAVVIAAGGGLWLVRRQLQPLREVASTAHEVAGLELSSGAIGTTVRVPEALTDERTEVGQVGSALNTLLAHVEGALDERHRSEQQVRQFVADASHELRTPLSTIHGYAELSRRTQPPDPAQLAVAMAKVEGEATRMSSLVEDLLLLARLDAGRPLGRDEVDLTLLALETVGDARVVGPEHRWLLDLGEEPVVLPGDELRLHQVVTNLLNNARRHTPPGTSVTVGVRGEGAEAVVSVTDDGPGMSPELVATAFERFTRGDSSRTRASGGAGLGLSLVQAIAGAHGGTVSVVSEPGRTRFEVRLPAPAGSTKALVQPHR